MTPIVRKVELGEGRIAFIRVQTAAEFLNMQAALNANSESDLSNTEKIKRGLAIKVASTLCDEHGTRKFLATADPDVVTGEFIWTDAQLLALAINESNGLSNKELEDAEKN